MSALFGGNVILATIVVAMVPLIELKGAIPIAMSADFWGGNALSTWSAFGWALLGSSLVVPIIAWLFRPVYNWLKTKKFFNKLVDFIVGDVVRRSEQVNNDAEQKTHWGRWWLKVITIFLFVAFPVPLTGVWTGTCFAVLLGLDFVTTCVCVIGGNTICGLLVTLVCNVFPNATNILLFVFLGLVAVALLVRIILHFVKHKKTEQVAN